MNARTIGVVPIAVLLAVGFGCNTGQDRQEADGTKVFGEQTLKDGTVKQRRVVYPDGRKLFNVTKTPDGIQKVERLELPKGQKVFNSTRLPDGTVKTERIEFANGEKQFDVTILPDLTMNVGRYTTADGKEIHTFWGVQNDQQGYADVKWGTDITSVDPSASGDAASSFANDLEENQVVAAALGVPTRDTVVAGSVLSTSIDFSLVPAEFKAVSREDVRLIFYNGEFAMAFSKLNAHNYEAIASELASKYMEMGESSVDWGGGAMSDGDNTKLSVRLFKRGETNTRVFLLKRTDHEGCCGVDVSSVYLLYIPDFYFEKIQGDIESMKTAKESQQIAEREKRELADKQKIQ